MLIGICGKKRSGKSTMASLLSEMYGYEELSFAEPIRSFARQVFGLDEEGLEKTKEHVYPELKISPRNFMQAIGEGIRQVHPDFWLNLVKHKLNQTKAKHVCISDVRYPNELKLIESLGGVTVYLEATNREPEKDTHVSENSIAPSDCTFHIKWPHGDLDIAKHYVMVLHLSAQALKIRC